MFMRDLQECCAYSKIYRAFGLHYIYSGLCHHFLETLYITLLQGTDTNGLEKEKRVLFLMKK